MNDRGLAKFRALDPHFTWNYDPQKSYVTYTIVPAQATVELTGNQTTVYGTALAFDPSSYTVTFRVANDQQSATSLLSLVQLVDASHTPASYVVTPAPTTVTINGAEHIQYGQPNTINYGGNNGYTMTITAPVHNGTVDNDHELIYTNVHLTTGDLEFVTTPGKVGTYQVKLSAQGVSKTTSTDGSFQLRLDAGTGCAGQLLR